jgi:N-acyl-D-aspartate/D-glutamate deacylase
MYDYILKGGTIFDGTGRKAFTADVAVANGRIAAVDTHLACRHAQVLDVTALAVAPGFIDIHSHSDTSFLGDERCESKLYQGVTSEVVGQCGSSKFPCLEEKLPELRQADEADGPSYVSLSFADFKARVAQEGRRMSTNLLCLVGHGTLRAGVLGYEDRPPTPAELSLMQRLLAKDLSDGAWGLSLGLGYTPGVSADIAELVALAAIVARYGGHVPAHMRDQGSNTPQSLEEMYAINRQSGARVHIAHFKAGGKDTWGRAPEFVRHVAAARQSGVAVTVDVYPYTAASSGITNSFPKWAIQGGLEQTLLRLQGPERAAIYAYLDENFSSRTDGESLWVVSTGGRFPAADGKNIWEISRHLGVSMAEAIIAVTEQSQARAVCISHSMDQAEVDFFLAQADYAVGSDGRALPLSAAENKGKPHPRNFGTFPRFLRLAREQGFATPETAIHRITRLPASIVGLTDRGTLAPGLVADLTVFCPKTITDRATYPDPFQKPVGIEHVFIAGRPAVLKAQQTDLRLGAFV